MSTKRTPPTPIELAERLIAEALADGTAKARALEGAER